ncbi:MAG: MBL fold metallo-hydrolase [Desulfobacterales bacterium]|nr:MBL fold metallo-hydrolase [Desulfobacterales bacterium]
MKSCRIGDFEIFWLNGGEFELDGGTMFGVVPKSLWAKKYPVDEDTPLLLLEENYIKLLNAPLLIKTPDSLVLVDTGLGNKLSDKQKQIFRVIKDWSLPGELKKLGLRRQDINYVILTHCDFDHAGGIVMYNPAGEEELTFPNAKHIVQKLEWEDAMQPNKRSANTYWKENFAKLKDTDNLQLVEGDFKVCPGIEVQHTGGHTRGHQIVRIQSEKEIAYHLADLLPTHVHFNPLWIMAYDNFPMDAIDLKEKYETLGIRENTWFTFYHDPSMYACKFDSQGQIVKKIDTVGPKKSTTLNERLHIQNLNVQKNNRVTLSCPSCLIVRDVSVDKYAGKKHFLTVNCPCGTTYGINLNFRKHYRKEVSIGGYYTIDEEDTGFAASGNVPTGAINCRIKNISLGGVGFSALSRVRVQVGDKLKVKFALDKEPPETIEKKVLVKGINDNYIGCEFIEESGFSDRTLGFYLMK